MRIGRKVVRDNARIVTKMTRFSHFWRIAHMGTVKKCAYKHNNARTNVARIMLVTYRNDRWIVILLTLNSKSKVIDD